jgi:hypothetical protein
MVFDNDMGILMNGVGLARMIRSGQVTKAWIALNRDLITRHLRFIEEMEERRTNSPIDRHAETFFKEVVPLIISTLLARLEAPLLLIDPFLSPEGNRLRLALALYGVIQWEIILNNGDTEDLYLPEGQIVLGGKYIFCIVGDNADSLSVHDYRGSEIIKARSIADLPEWAELKPALLHYKQVRRNHYARCLLEAIASETVFTPSLRGSFSKLFEQLRFNFNWTTIKEVVRAAWALTLYRP